MAGGKNDSWLGLAGDPPIAISAFCVSVENPHSTRAPQPGPGHTRSSLPSPQAEGQVPPPCGGSSRCACPTGRAPGLASTHLKRLAGLPTGLPPGRRGGPPPELPVLQAPEMLILHLPVRKAIIGNRIHSPGNVTSSGHRSPGRETLLGPGPTTDTTDGSSALWLRVTSLRLGSET